VAAALGESLRRIGRSSDAIGRLGPLEFAVIAPATGPDEAVRLVERLRQTVETLPIPLNAHSTTVELRAGYYAVPDFAKSNIDATEMLLRATTALRSLRDEGTGRLRAFEVN
jgi:diguanylate cyclase (GGDEF)-like protein